MRTRMPPVTGVKATEVAMTVATEEGTSVPTGPAVPSPTNPFSIPTMMKMPRPVVELAVGYGLSSETAAAGEQSSGDKPGHHRTPRQGVSHYILRKRFDPARVRRAPALL